MNNINFYKTVSADNDAGDVINYPLEVNLTKVRPNKGYSKVIFCIYKKVSVDDKHFLQYLLYKYNDKDTLYFPFVNKKDLENEFLKKVFNKEDYILKGYRIFNECLLTYVMVSSIDHNIICKKSGDNWWWSTIEEIVNSKSVYIYKIHKSVTDIFYMNHDMCFLLNYKNEKLPVPKVLYKSSDSNTTDFELIFGFYRASIWNSLGPFYIFSPYENAVSYATKIKRYISSEFYENNSGYGAIRVVSFMGESKVFINSEKDPEQKYNDVELMILEDKNASDERKNKIINFRRLADHEGNWALSYDSAQVGNVVEKNKVVYDGNGMIGFKDFNNIIILDYIKLDNKGKVY